MYSFALLILCPQVSFILTTPIFRLFAYIFFSLLQTIISALAPPISITPPSWQFSAPKSPISASVSPETISTLIPQASLTFLKK
jgi:hypothetical protein